MTQQLEPDDCADCGGPLTGRVIHDRGEAWHHHCRKALIALRAERRAVRLTMPRMIHIGRALAEAQRAKPTVVAVPA